MSFRAMIKAHNHLQRSSEDSNDSDFTEVTAKTSFDTVLSISSISTSVSAHSIPIPSTVETVILHTNYQPSPQEAAEIHAIIDTKRQKLFELERRKEVLDRQREFLDRQRRLLDEELGVMSEEIDQYSGVIGCGMRNMPSDLLLEIFHLYVTDSECTSSLGSATTLTHVCRMWRQIALSSPALWVTLTVPHLTPQIASNVFQRLGQVKTAIGIPLEFNINLRRSTDVHNEEFQQLSSDLVNASIAHVHRWKSFSLCCEDELFTAGIHKELFHEVSEAPRLETLKFAFSVQNAEWSPSPWLLSLLHAAPVLRYLQLQLPSLSVRALSPLSLSHLESLTLDLPTVTPAALLFLLGDVAPNLKVCHVNVAGLVNFETDEDDPHSAYATSMVVHSCLEVFEIRLSRGASPEAMSQLFDNLTLPIVREVLLEIGNFQEPSSDSITLPDELELSWPHESFLGLLERASPSVTSLCLGFDLASPESADNAWGGMGSIGSELEEEHVRAYLELKNVGGSLATLHVRRDRPVWPELLEYLTLSASHESSHTCSLDLSDLSSVSDDLGTQPLRNLENIALDIDPIFQVLSMRDLVKSRWYDNLPSNSPPPFARLRTFSITLCFPDIPNLELESASARKVFQRIAQGDELEGKLEVVFHRRRYTMMPMDVPLVTLGSELIV
ncbi:hypothetical protein EV368DRAFT_85358 [Lentinula lateritia]|uniref:Uncharacterized protein n=1 Tax=Lentinula aff. lateritia TaxID=2804960 RepID=A0ACC1U958_9AGAR|nr:hypothetical protein F5876DRAFT_73748 [Lentinula aff. lateritia]KAJ3849631.1 hypothetical protein EV368DRAFT_85358 [Lentinula lateritia]